MAVPTLVQPNFAGSPVSLPGALTPGNLLVAVPMGAGNDTWTRDNRVGGFCPLDVLMTKYGKAGSNFFRSSGANSTAILGKTVLADTYPGPFAIGPNCDAAGAGLLMEWSGIVVDRVRVNLIEGVGSDGAGNGGFSLDFAGARPGSLLVMAAAMKRDGYGGSPAVDVAPTGFTEIVDGSYVVNGWEWCGYKINSGAATITYNTHDGPFEGWGAIAVLFEPPAGGMFAGEPGGSRW